MATTPAPASAPTPAPRRSPIHRLGTGLLMHLWPAVAVFLGTAFALWDRAEPKVVWIVAGASTVLFLVLLRVLWRRAKGVARSAGQTLRGLFVALVLVAALVALVWFLILR